MLAQRLAICLVLLSFINGCTNRQSQHTYGTPTIAANSLIQALRSESSEGLGAVLGGESRDIVRSGDTVADEQNRQAFLKLYDEHHELIRNADGSNSLLVGNDKWPFPIPLVLGQKGWRFDTAAGREEILARRIGNNEQNAIEVCLAIVDAQRDYAAMDVDGDHLAQYAQKFFSDEGKKDGLYWRAAPGEPASPLGSLVASAADDGYDVSKRPAKGAYHGYRYRILKSQGSAAPGGARDFIIDGKMIGGFAAIAYPVEYGNSGIMSFIVSHDGVVRQADLGDNTVRIASSMSVYNPDEHWSLVLPE
jgi:hypothetical protein